MAILTRIASDGMPIEMTDCTMDKAHTKLAVIAPTYKRYPERAGKTITVEPGWEVTYDDRGYFASMKNTAGKVAAPKHNFAFVNDFVGDEMVPVVGTYYKDATASSDDGILWTVYDGATNYVCLVNSATKEIIPNVGNSTDKSLVDRMTSYGEAFLKAYLH